MISALRQARSGDRARVHQIVRGAYAPYVDQLDREPAPMARDYGDDIRAGEVWVTGEPIVAVIVLIQDGAELLIENVCVDPDHQGLGLGRELLGFAERHAVDRGLTKLTLYANEVMTANIALYRHLGYEEADRRVESGYRRVYLTKSLR